MGGPEERELIQDARTWAIGGASGLVGLALVARLQGRGDRVVRLVRREIRGADEIRWDPIGDSIDAESLSGMDGVVNLAGESLIALRWSAEKKRRIEESRVSTTRLIARALRTVDRQAKVWLNASAIGFYGVDRPEEILTERSAPGADFLARTCQAWEDASALPEGHPTQVVLLRTGVVLSADGGALQKMLPPFRLGVGGRVGNGRQFMSWIDLRDLVGAIEFLLDASVAGPVNLVAPNPATNRDFTRALAQALARPAWFPLPAFAIRLLMGEMGEALLLADQRVMPQALLDAGFEFQYPTLAEAFDSLTKPH